MTREHVEQVVADWQGRLGLQGWKITFAWDRPTSSAIHATIHRDDQYDTAILRLSKVWETWTEEKLSVVLVHELLHLHFRDIDRTIESVKGALHPDAWTMVSGRYDHEVEGLIDRLAHRLVEIAA